jgi:hypothetical protein
MNPSPRPPRRSYCPRCVRERPVCADDRCAACGAPAGDYYLRPPYAPCPSERRKSNRHERKER